jgi:hypothetical protein
MTDEEKSYEGPVTVARFDGIESGTADPNFNECILLQIGTAEVTVEEELEGVGLSCDSLQRLGGGQGAREIVRGISRSQKSDTVTSVRVDIVVENGRIKDSGTKTFPVGVARGEAETGTFVVAFETTVRKDVLAAVSARLGHFEVSLTEVESSRFIGDQVVLEKDFSFPNFIPGKKKSYHGASISGRPTIDHCSPDVEVLAPTTDRVSTTRVAEISTSLHVVSVKEGESHILQDVYVS